MDMFTSYALLLHTKESPIKAAGALYEEIKKRASYQIPDITSSTQEYAVNLVMKHMRDMLDQGKLRTECVSVCHSVDRAFKKVWDDFKSDKVNKASVEELYIALRRCFFFSTNVYLSVVESACNFVDTKSPNDLLRIAECVYSSEQFCNNRESDSVSYFNRSALAAFNAMSSVMDLANVCVQLMPSTYMTQLPNPVSVVKTAFEHCAERPITANTTQLKQEIEKVLSGVKV